MKNFDYHFDLNHYKVFEKKHKTVNGISNNVLITQGTFILLDQ